MSTELELNQEYLTPKDNIKDLIETQSKSNLIISGEEGLKYYLLLEGIDISYTKFTELVNLYCNFIDNLLDGNSLDSQNIPFVVAKLMVELESLKTLKGVEKKRLLGVILKVYTDKKASEDEQLNRLNMFLSNSLSGMIDTMVSIDKGQINIEKVATSCAKICLSNLLQVILLRNSK